MSRPSTKERVLGVYRLRLLLMGREASMKAGQFAVSLVHLQDRHLSEVMSI